MLRKLLGMKEYPRLRCHAKYQALLRNKAGLEIGGPSPVFRKHGLLPLYPYVGSLDNCNFGGQTVWEGTITEGSVFRYHKQRPPGRQIIAEATDLKAIPANSCDFVLSSHMVEHSANPLQALREWLRILREGGVLVLVLPHREETFDHRRPVTSLAHLVADYEQQMTEADLTHLPEILALHDLSLDPGSEDFESFRQRSANNVENRCLHHHVFDTQLVVEVADHLELQILDVETALPHHIFVMAQKLAAGRKPANERYLGSEADHRQSSVFASDRPSPLLRPRPDNNPG